MFWSLENDDGGKGVFWSSVGSAGYQLSESTEAGRINQNGMNMDFEKTGKLHR